MVGKRIIRTVMSFLLIIGILLTCMPLKAYAYDEEYKTFLQGDPRWGSHGTGTSGEPIASVGCAVTSFAILMAYADPELRDVEKFNPAVCNDEYLQFAGAAVYWDPIKGPLTRVPDAVLDGSSEEALTKSVKVLLDKGYYIIMWGSDTYPGGTHYSPIVGWNNEKEEPIVFDVAGGWDGFDWHGFAHSTNVGDIHVYKADKPSYEAFEEVGSPKNSKKTDEEASEEAEIALTEVLNQWELHGMPDPAVMAGILETPDLADRDNMLLNELQSMRVIKEDMDDSNVSFYRAVNVFCSFSGIILIVYSIILWASYMVDISNNFSHLSLVGFITFGRIKVLDYEEKLTPELQKDGYVSKKGLFVRCSILFGCGCLLISGILVKLISIWVFGLF